jgi:hypothetical protein
VADQQAGSEAVFDEARAALYREPPEDFVAARDRLVRELRGRKERELASRVARLRRPPLSLWLANRLHEVAGPQLRELFSAGGELQAAQASAASGDAGARRRFRELIGRHSQLIDGLVRAGLALSEEQGHGSGEEVGRRLAATLRAASTEPGDAGRALLEGRLEAEMEPGGFALVTSPPSGAGFGAREPAGTAGTPAAGVGEGERDQSRESALETAARAAEARRAAVESERAAMAARSRAEELSHRADALAREARKAREEADAAQEKARSAEEAAAEAQQAARQLERPPRS